MRFNITIIVLVAVLFAAASTVSTPISGANSTARIAPTPGDKKGFSDYRGIAVGMTTEAVRTKLGAPKDKSDAMDLYMYGDTESAQFYYDASKSVTAIMITYSGDLKNAPLPKDVLGEDAETRPDGGIFKMVRFPKSGFWISYNRTAPPDPIVNIAIQKM